MTNCEVVANEPDEYVTVQLPGLPVMPKPEKVATPELDVALPVPTTVPLESDAVTTADDDVTTLLPAS